MSCPKCRSHEWKMASVVHAGGLSNISTSTMGVGIGADANAFGGGVGVASTKGTHQTTLSKLAAPPAKPTWKESGWNPFLTFGMSVMVVDGFVIYLLRNVTGIDTLTAFLMTILLIAVVVVFIGMNVVSPEVAEKHRRALIEYEKLKMCLRCGTLFQ